MQIVRAEPPEASTGFPRSRGKGWQERWLVSGVDRGLDGSRIDLITAEYGSTEAPRRALTTDGLGCLLLARVVRPSNEFLQSWQRAAAGDWAAYASRDQPSRSRRATQPG